MNIVAGEIIGEICITICKTPEGYKFFQIKANNEIVLPLVDLIEDTLINY